MDDESRPEPTLSADEADAWRRIEDHLRHDLADPATARPVSARPDAMPVRVVAALVVGSVIVVGATRAPSVLAVGGTIVVGVSLGLLVSRGLIALLGRQAEPVPPWVFRQPRRSVRRARRRA